MQIYNIRCFSNLSPEIDKFVRIRGAVLQMLVL